MATIDVKSEVMGTVWKVEVEPGQSVEPGGVVMVIESMKMEIPVIAEDGGKVVKLLVAENDAVSEGQTVAELEG